MGLNLFNINNIARWMITLRLIYVSRLKHLVNLNGTITIINIENSILSVIQIIIFMIIKMQILQKYIIIMKN